MRLDASFYTFAHEIGHNLGCNHAADQELEPGLFPIRMAGGLLVETGRNTGRYCPISVYLMNVRFHFPPIHTRAMKSAIVVGGVHGG
ncbi:MAG: M12 family metallo-peptidase [Limisphaerales bacterium]